MSKKNHTLKGWEISLIKAMLLKEPRPRDQDILAYFTRPARSINHRVIGEIRTEAKHKNIKACNNEQLERFLQEWPL